MGDCEGDKAEKDPGNKSMSIVVVGLADIAEAQNVKLALTSSTSGIDWKEDRPRDAASRHADEDEQLEET